MKKERKCRFIFIFIFKIITLLVNNKISILFIDLQVDPLQVGTDGFLMNLCSVLLTFADPFMGYTKVIKILNF